MQKGKQDPQDGFKFLKAAYQEFASGNFSSACDSFSVALGMLVNDDIPLTVPLAIVHVDYARAVFKSSKADTENAAAAKDVDGSADNVESRDTGETSNTESAGTGESSADNGTPADVTLDDEDADIEISKEQLAYELLEVARIAFMRAEDTPFNSEKLAEIHHILAQIDAYKNNYQHAVEEMEKAIEYLKNQPLWKSMLRIECAAYYLQINEASKAKAEITCVLVESEFDSDDDDIRKMIYQVGEILTELESFDIMEDMEESFWEVAQARLTARLLAMSGGDPHLALTATRAVPVELEFESSEESEPATLHSQECDSSTREEEGPEKIDRGNGSQEFEGNHSQESDDNSSQESDGSQEAKQSQDKDSSSQDEGERNTGCMSSGNDSQKTIVLSSQESSPEVLFLYKKKTGATSEPECINIASDTDTTSSVSPEKSLGFDKNTRSPLPTTSNSNSPLLASSSVPSFSSPSLKSSQDSTGYVADTELSPVLSPQGSSSKADRVNDISHLIRRKRRVDENKASPAPQNGSPSLSDEISMSPRSGEAGHPEIHFVSDSQKSCEEEDEEPVPASRKMPEAKRRVDKNKASPAPQNGSPSLSDEISMSPRSGEAGHPEIHFVSDSQKSCEEEDEEPVPASRKMPEAVHVSPSSNPILAIFIRDPSIRSPIFGRRSGVPRRIRKPPQDSQQAEEKNAQGKRKASETKKPDDFQEKKLKNGGI